MEIQELELRDLPKADADELRAFVDKRRWFEARLKTLQALPPIYPFVQLAQSDAGTSEQVQWTLPSAEVLKQWRLERDRIELEVFAFDGGDLGRMKAKTREVTMIPLTPPSTHLISITLTTIVLVDKLLSLLRSRGETLELTAYRLEWNGLCATVQVELRALEKEAKSLAGDKARWRAEEDASKLDKTRRTSLLDSPGALKLATTTTGSPGPSPAATSALVQQGRPTKSLQLPLLHSHIANLRIRHRTLNTTTLARTGTVLDKMIDKAAGLRGLGGLHGPEEDKQSGGALPDEFLDVQDALDDRAGSLERLIEVCEALERQWTQTATYHAAAAAIELKTAKFINDIAAAKTTDDLEEIKRKFGGLHILAPISNLVMPVHADLPDLAEHNRRVTLAVEEVTKGSQRALKNLQSTLDAREALFSARVTLHANRAATQEVQQEVDTLVQWLQSSPDRPNTSTLSFLANDADDWQDSLSSRRAAAEAIRVRAAKLAQQGVLALLRHKQTIGHPLDQIDEDLRRTTEEHSDGLVSCVRSLFGGLEAADKEAALLRQARQVALAEERIARESERLEEVLTDAVALAKWTNKRTATTAETSTVDFATELQRGTSALQQEVVAPLAAIEGATRTYAPLHRHLTDSRRTLEMRESSLHRLSGSLKRLMKQKSAMEEVEAEFDHLQSSTSELQTNLAVILDGEDIAIIAEDSTPRLEEACEALQGLIRSFVDGLAERVPLVTAGNSSISSHLISNISGSHTVPRSPHTTSSQSGNEDPDDLKFVDDGVRAAVNEMAARLISGLDRTQTLLDAVKQVVQRRQERTRAVEQQQDLCERIERATRFHRQRLKELGPAAHSGEHRQEDLDALLEDADSDQLQLRHQAKQIGVTSLPSADLDEPSGSGARLLQANETLLHLVSEIRAAANASEGPNVVEKDASLPVAPSEATRFSSETDTNTGDSKRTDIPQSPPTSAITESFKIPLPEQSLSVESGFSSATSHQAVTEADLPILLPELRQSDVFGPHTVSSPSVRSSKTASSTFIINHDGISRQISLLRDRLDSTGLDTVVYPTSLALTSTPSLRRLPSEVVAEKLKVELLAISEETEDLVVPDGHRDWDEYHALCDAVKARVALLPQLDHLVAFASAATDCEEVMSKLLERVDELELGQSPEHAEAVRLDAEETLKKMEEAALTVESDSRVAQELGRLRTGWRELQAVTRRALDPDRANDDSDDGASVATSYSLSRSVSTMSVTSQPPKQIPFPSRLPKSQSTRTVSNPLSASVTASTEASRSRAVSDRPAVSGLPRFRKDPITLSTIPGTPTRKRVESTSSIPRPVRAVAPSPVPSLGRSPSVSMRQVQTSNPSLTPMKKFKTLPRSRSKSGLEAVSKPRVSAGVKPVPKVYVSDPKNKLDVAVGKIVNRLKVDIPIAPVGLDWQDESGKYWIGAEGRAKLCFCRILRSRTVMVRVGGGWAELSRFLLDHFADEMVQLPAAIDPAVLSPVSEPKLLPSTPAPVRHTVTGTPGHASPSKSPGGGASPLSLVAMQLIRKASESPPVREKERERMWSPRRSLLG